jgi:F0F1-type ATP synthase epsilon subunit
MDQKGVANNDLKVDILWHSYTRDPDFHGKAYSVTTENNLGPFDILPLHANLISLIQKRIVVKTKDGKEVDYQFRNGVMEVSGNVVKVFLGI